MACTSCKAVNNFYTAPNRSVIPVVIDCDTPKEVIETLYQRLICYRESNTHSTNKELGILLTMLNLKEYCKYDTTSIKTMLNNSNC